MIRRFALAAVIFVAFLSVWQVGEDRVSARRIEAGLTGIEAFIPSPATIVASYRENGRTILTETGYTMARAGVGFAAGTTFAFLAAVVFLLLPRVRAFFFPVAFAINSFPIVGLAPVVVLAFGQGTWGSIVFIAALISYFPTLISLDASFREADPELLELMHVFNANRWQIMTKVSLPLAMPALLTAMKLAVPASIIGATMGEWLGSRHGIGQLITISLYQLRPGLLYASLFTIAGVIGLLLFLIALIKTYLFPWRKNGSRTA